MRLIDADALTEELKGAIERNHEYHMVVIDNDFKTLIDDAPIIEPVRHGRWILTETALNEYANCSECGAQVMSDEAWHYCPNCGAKMGGDADD